MDTQTTNLDMKTAKPGRNRILIIFLVLSLLANIIFVVFIVIYFTQSSTILSNNVLKNTPVNTPVISITPIVTSTVTGNVTGSITPAPTTASQTTKFTGSYVSAQIPAGYQINEYTLGKLPATAPFQETKVEGVKYPGLTSILVSKNGNNLFGMYLLTGVGDPGVCVDVKIFSDTDSTYLQDLLNGQNSWRVTANDPANLPAGESAMAPISQIQIANGSYLDFNFLGIKGRAISNQVLSTSQYVLNGNNGQGSSSGKFQPLCGFNNTAITTPLFNHEYGLWMASNLNTANLTELVGVLNSFQLVK